ncbi:hypothetical protein KIW84_075664 [Lathyrus oleraceus]|uniref:Retrotransposon gag domain-containing protein n=1 Tax=Pisum sativum TaxID=3888 RepID=A0A9D5A1B6_PEA|nr:hypothetical protein KIW84_075664 [Pisum sativum]
MMESVLAAQSQSSPTPATAHPQRIVISEVATSTIPTTAAHFAPNMLAGFPWGMPPNFMPEGFAPTFASIPTSSPVMSVPPPVVHTLPRLEDTIYHSEPSEGPDVYEKMDEMKDQFLELRKELKTLRGKDMFGKSAAELCLVPNVKIPVKFKVPDFEKYKGNTYRDQLRSLSQKDKETFKEYAQRWRELATQITPPLEENEMTKIFLKTLSSFYYEKMIASAPNDFTEMKERKANAVSVGRQRSPRVRRNQPPRQHHHQASSVIPVFSNNQSTPIQQQQCQQQQPRQRTNTYNNNNTNNHFQQQQNFERMKVSFDPIPMTYIESYPSLVLKNLLQPRNPPQIPKPLPWWYKPKLRCAFHQEAPDHDIHNGYPLKYEVQKLVKSGMVSFEDRASNIKANPLPVHGNSSINMVDGCPGEFKVFDVRFIRRYLVTIHKDICLVSDCEHDHDGCAICSVNLKGCMVVKRDIQRLMDEGLIQIVQSRHVDDDVNVIVSVFKTPERVVIQYDSSNSNSVNNRSVSLLVIRLVGPVPYASDKVVPYHSSATMIDNGQEVPLPTTNSVVSIADVTKVTHSGRVFGPVFPKNVEDIYVSKKVDAHVVDSASSPKCQSGESIGLKPSDDDEVLRFNQKKRVQCGGAVAPNPLQDFMDQFDHIVANITSCNNLSFCDKELPEQARNHNLALHISMNCKDDALSNVLVDTGSSLNVLPKSTLSRLPYQGAPMRYSGVIVKAFDGSRKTVIGKVELLMKIGPSDFQINFQVMDIHKAYSCLLGSPWIHEAGAVTSTLHQKLKFIKNGKLVIVRGEKALLERMVEVYDNKSRAGWGFQQGSSVVRAEDVQPSFHIGWFIHGNGQHSAVVIEGDEDEDCTNFVTHGKACNNWTAIDITVIVHRSKINEITFSGTIKDLAEVFSGTIEDLAELKVEGGFKEKPNGLSFENWSVLTGLLVTFAEQIQPKFLIELRSSGGFIQEEDLGI